MNRLFVDEIVSVGMVSAGDNPDAEVMIYKSHPDSVSMPDRAKSPLIGSGASMDLSVIEDEALRESITKALAEKDEQISVLETEIGKSPPDPEDEATDEVKALIKEARDENAQLRKDLDAERSERRVAEFVAKAEPFAGLFGKPEEVGPVLAELSDGAPEAYEKFEGWLKAASQRQELAELFSEKGTGNLESESDPIEKRDAWVNENQKDDETVAQANARFWKEHPEQTEASRE